MNKIKNTRSQYRNVSVLMLVFIILISCDPVDTRLKIINKSNSDIYFFYSCDSSLTNLKIFRNGYYSNSIGDSVYVTADQIIKKHSSLNIGKRLGFGAWKSFVNSCPNQEINFYFFADSIVSRSLKSQF